MVSNHGTLQLRCDELRAARDDGWSVVEGLQAFSLDAATSRLWSSSSGVALRVR